MDLGQLLLELVKSLVLDAVKQGVDYAAQGYFQQRRIERRVEDAVAEVVEPLIPFLTQEGLSEKKQKLLMETCVLELRPLLDKPEKLFQGSLNGQKIFEDKYGATNLPQAITDEGLSEPYVLVYPRVATLLCKVPETVKDWESEAWSENYRRFDQLIEEIRALFAKVDSLSASSRGSGDEVLALVRRAVSQKVGFELDLTGLRADRPLACKLDDLFVHPELKLREERREVAVVERHEVSVIDRNEATSEFTRKDLRHVITGAPGAGKSTWSKWLQREVVGEQWSGLAIRAELRAYATLPPPSIHDLIRDAAGKHLAEELEPTHLAKWLEAGQVLIILDGFDEVPPETRDDVEEWINELDNASRSSPIVLTSRPLTTKHLQDLGNSWKSWTLEPFNKPRIVDFITRWHRHFPLLSDTDRVVDPESLASSWHADPTIGPLTSNPLLLSTLLIVHHLDGKLPNGRSELYRRYIEGMLDIWDSRRKISMGETKITLEQKKQIVRKIALNLHLAELDQIGETEIKGMIQDQLGAMNLSVSADELLTHLSERSGLLQGPGTYSFVHKSVAEYFVADCVFQGDQRDAGGRRIDRFRLFKERSNDRWNTVIFMWAGIAPISDVESFIDECFRVKDWRLALGIVEDQSQRISRDNKHKYLKTIPAIPLKDKDAEQARTFYYSGPGEFRKGSRGQTELLPAPMILVRSLRDLEFVEIIEFALAEGALSWSDFEKANNVTYLLTWYTCATNPNDTENWTYALCAKPPKLGPSLAWLFWAGSISLSKCIYNQNSALDPSEILEKYEEYCPSMRGASPFLVMSLFMDYVYLEVEKLADYVNILLPLLNLFRDSPIESVWLEHFLNYVNRRGIPESVAL